MDAVERYVCQEGREKFRDAVKLNDIDSVSDPETEPFKSKYQAREKWMSIKTELEESLSEGSNLDFAKFLLAVVYFKIGNNFSETEELSSGEEYLCKCVDIIKPLRLHEKACNTLQIAYNQLGILWTTRRQPQKALEYLQDAEALYLEYKKEVGNGPYQSDELFDIKQGGEAAESDTETIQKRSENFEHCYTLTQYYLAQVYAKLEENEKSAKYCHTTLRRQLEMKKYDPIDWALNAATLSQFYMTVGKMSLARHCLASAQRILSETGDPSLQVSVNEDDSQADVDRKEKIPRCWADLYRCWIKYGLSLMENSMTRLIEKVNSGKELDLLDEDNDENKTDREEDQGASNDHNADKKPSNTENNPEDSTHNEANACGGTKKESSENENNKSLFFDLELTSIEEVITDKYLRVFEEARPVFLQIQKWIGQSKEFYLLDGHCTDHVELIQDHSKAFKLLAFYELDFERQCKMHKRRVDMLEAVLKELSQQFYLMICRQLMYEIAEIYSAMLDLKLAIIEEAGSAPNPHAVKKINQLTMKSITEFERYVDTLKTGSDKKTLPSQFSSDDERPALIAYFCMGRLHSKFLEFEVSKKLDNMRKSLECYKFLVDYCNTNPTAKNVVGSECEICTEMVALMPFKMEKLRNQMT